MDFRAIKLGFLLDYTTKQWENIENIEKISKVEQTEWIQSLNERKKMKWKRVLVSDWLTKRLQCMGVNDVIG